MKHIDQPAGCKDRRFGRALQDLFAGRRPARLPISLPDHLAGCPACRTLARTLASADRLLGEECGAPEGVSPFEIELAWQALSSNLKISRRRSRRFVARLLPAALGLVLVLVAGIFVATRHDNGGFAARGAAAAPDLLVVCIPPGAKPAPRPAGAGAGPAACRIDETLGFAYLNPGGRFGGLALYAVDDSDHVLWYAPNPVEPGGLAVEAAARPRALKRTVRLAVNHRPGRYTLVAAFTPAPISLAGLGKKLALDLARDRRSLPGARIIRRKLIISREEQP